MMESYDAYCTARCYTENEISYNSLFRVDDIFINKVPTKVLHSKYSISVEIKLTNFPVTS